MIFSIIIIICVYLNESNWINDFNFNTSDDEKQRVYEKLLNERQLMLIDKFFLTNFFMLTCFDKLSESINVNSYIVLFDVLIIIANISLLRYRCILNNTSNQFIEFFIVIKWNFITIFIDWLIRSFCSSIWEW